MGFEIISYDKLRVNIIGCIVGLAQYYKHYGAKAEEVHDLINAQSPYNLSSKYPNISPERLPQISLFLAFIRYLDKSELPEEKKTLILHSLACYFYYVIDESQKKRAGVMSYIVSLVVSSGSKLHEQLALALNIRAGGNELTPSDLFPMLRELRDFLYLHTYKNPENPIDGYLPLQEQLFSAQRVLNFDLDEFLRELNLKMTKVQNKVLALTRAAQLFEVSQASVQDNGSFGTGVVTRGSFTLDSQTGDSIRYEPPVKAEPTLDSVKAEPTLDSVKAEPTLDSVKAEPTLDSVKAEPTLDSVKAEPTLDSVKAEPTLEPVKAEPTVESVQARPIDDSMNDESLASSSINAPTGGSSKNSKRKEKRAAARALADVGLFATDSSQTKAPNAKADKTIQEDLAFASPM